MRPEAETTTGCNRDAAPIKHEELLKSANLLKDFGKLWAQCQTIKAQHELISQILDRVVVIDQEVIALVLKGDTALLMNQDTGVSPYGEGGTRTLTS